MKQGWEVKKLGEICDLQNGFAFKSKDYIDFSNTMNFRMSQIRPGGGIDLENNPKFLPDEYVIKYKDYLLKEGDVVIAMTDLATETKILGVPTIVPKDNRNWLLNQRVGKLFKIDFSKVYLPYLKYILTSETVNKYYKSLGRGGLQINIGKQDILNAKIPLPPLQEQQRIVAILDEAFTAIDKAKANTEQNLKNAKELFESELQRVFNDKGEGWEEKTLGEILDFFNGFAFKSKDAIENSNTQLVRIGNLYQNELNLERRAVYYPDEFAKSFSKYLLKSNDLIISLTGTTGKEDYGYTVKIPENNYNLLLNQRIAKICIKNENETDKDYLLHFLLSRIFLDKLYKTANGTRQANLSTETMKSILINVPDFTKQQTIVSKLDALLIQTKKLEAVYTQKLQDLEELKKSVLQKAFSGELN